MYQANDVLLPQSYANPQMLNELFQHLRKDNPIAKTDHPDFHPYYLITKAADIMEIESKPEVFLSAPQMSIIDKKTEEGLINRYGTINPLRHLLVMDPPEHSVYRNILQSWFTPGNLAKLKEKIKEHAKSYVDKMASWKGEENFVNQVSLHFPLDIIMEIMGFPLKDNGLLLRLTQEVLAPADPNVKKDSEEDLAAALANTVMEVSQYFLEIAEDRRNHPRDDVSTLIALALIDGKPIPNPELFGYFALIFMAGHDTTSSTLGVSMLLLSQKKELLQALKNDPSLIPATVEELIRWIVPVKHFVRTASQDYTIRGVEIKKGERVVLCYQSGCRDEEYVEDPFTFRIDRKPNRHLAFGFGPHRCLGQHLARLELITFFEELVPRLESAEIAGEFTFMQSSLVSGLKKLPLKVKVKA